MTAEKVSPRCSCRLSYAGSSGSSSALRTLTQYPPLPPETQKTANPLGCTANRVPWLAPQSQPFGCGSVSCARSTVACASADALSTEMTNVASVSSPRCTLPRYSPASAKLWTTAPSMVSAPLSRPIWVKKFGSNDLFISRSHVRDDDHLVRVDCRRQVPNRDLHGNQSGFCGQNRVRVLELVDRILAREVVCDGGLDRTQEVELVAEKVREPLLHLADDAEEVLHEVQDWADQRPQEVLRPARHPARNKVVDRGLDGVLEQVSDRGRDVDRVDVNPLRVDEDAPLVRVSVELRIEVRPSWEPGRVDVVSRCEAGLQIRDLGDEPAEVERRADRAADAEPRERDEASVPRIRNDAEAAHAKAGQVKADLRFERVPHDVDVLYLDRVVVVEGDAAALQVQRDRVARRERAEVRRVRLAEGEVVAECVEELREPVRGGGDRDVAHRISP